MSDISDEGPKFEGYISENVVFQDMSDSNLETNGPFFRERAPKILDVLCASTTFVLLKESSINKSNIFFLFEWTFKEVDKVSKYVAELDVSNFSKDFCLISLEFKSRWIIV